MIKKDKTQFIYLFFLISLKNTFGFTNYILSEKEPKTRTAKTKSIAIERQQLPEAMTRVQGRAI